MKKHRGLALVLGLAAAVPLQSVAEFIEFQRAIESDDVIVFVGTDVSGTVSVAPCDGCERQTFTIDGDTRAFHNNKAMPIQAAKSLSGKVKDRSVTVIYDVEDRTAEKILWWTSN